MEHCNDDDLSIIALGEPASPADEAHLQQCPRCQSRLDQLSAVVSTARQIDAKDSLMTPPPAVWDAIADELDMQPGVTSLSSRRRPRSGWLLAAAAAAVGVAIGSVATIGVTSTGETSPAVLAEVGLEPVGDQAVSGAAASSAWEPRRRSVSRSQDCPPSMMATTRCGWRRPMPARWLLSALLTRTALEASLCPAAWMSRSSRLSMSRSSTSTVTPATAPTASFADCSPRDGLDRQQPHRVQNCAHLGDLVRANDRGPAEQRQHAEEGLRRAVVLLEQRIGRRHCVADRQPESSKSE